MNFDAVHWRRSRSRYSLAGCVLIISATSIACIINLYRHDDKMSSMHKAADVAYGLEIICNAQEHLPFTTSNLSRLDRGPWTWRLLVVMALGDWKRDIQFDSSQPWDSPGNNDVATNPLSGRSVSRKDKSVLFAAVHGEGTKWDYNSEVRSIMELKRCYLLFVEVNEPTRNWLSPWDVDVADLQSDRALSEITWCPRTIVAGFSDGWIHLLKGEIPQRVVARLAIDGCPLTDGPSDEFSEWVVTSYRAPLLVR